VSLKDAVDAAMRAWAIGDRAQREVLEGTEGREETRSGLDQQVADFETLYAHLRRCMAEKTIECALLDRQMPGPSKYRMLGRDELDTLLPPDLSASCS
jgi:proteasome alpha subunit